MILFNKYATVLLALSLALPAHAQHSSPSHKHRKSQPVKQQDQARQESREWNMVKEANAPVTTIRVQQPDGSISEEQWKMVQRR